MGCFVFPGNRLRAVGRAAFGGIAAVGLLYLLMGAPARGDLSTNDLSRQPICVDGVPTDEETLDDDLSFVIGSLFDGKDDPFQNSRAAYALRQDEDDPKLPYGLYMTCEFGLRTRTFTPGEVIGKLTYPTTVNGVSRPNFTVWLVGVATTDPDAAKGCKAFFDLDGNGTFEGLAATLGIKAACSFLNKSLPAPVHLYLEAFFLVNAPKNFFTIQGLKSGQSGIFPVLGSTPLNGFLATDTSTTPIQASSAVITFASNGTTSSDSNGLPIRTVFEVKNASSSIGSSDLGALPVTIFTTLPRLDVRNVNVNSLRLRGTNIANPDPSFGAKANKGSTTFKDVNGDGQLDLVVHFNFKDAPGALNSLTTVLQLTGTLDFRTPSTTDDRPILGTDAVKIVQ